MNEDPLQDFPLLLRLRSLFDGSRELPNEGHARGEICQLVSA